MASETVIPHIDISTLLETSTEQHHQTQKSIVMSQISKACSEIGFMSVTGHGVPPTLINSMVAATKQFMYLPSEAKLKCASQYLNPHSENKYRGYWPSSVFGKEGFDITDPDYKKSMKLDFSLYEENVFPVQLSADWLEIIQQYYTSLHRLSTVLLKSIFEIFNADPCIIETALQRPTALTTMRMNYYPEHSEYDVPVETSDTGVKLACETHTDGAIMTILYQDRLGGLQVQSPTDLQWYDVPFQKEAFVVNTGVGLQVLTNNKWVATNHRVLFNTVERISLPMFIEPIHSFEMNSRLLVPNEEPVYPTQTYGEYLINNNKRFKEYQRESDK